MSIPFYCVTVAFCLLFLTKVPVGVAMGQMPKGYNNRHPRDQQAQLVGWGRRALAAHMNAFESFPPFAAAVLVAHVANADPTWSAGLAIGHVVARVAYTAAYVADIHAVRTSIWFASTFCTLALFLLPAFGPN